MRAAWLTTLFLLTAACSDALPCSACPPIDGTYAVSWQTDAGGSVALADGGLASADCPGPRPATWLITERSPDAVTLVIDDQPLQGVLYDTYDLSLTGAVGQTRWQVHALAIPQDGIDAGMQLQGTFDTTVPTDSGDICQSREAFTAQRTSR